MTAGIEAILWVAIFAGDADGLINGFDRSHYLAYVLLAAFTARVSANWMYEYRMMKEIETGTVNALLVRPISFFSAYLNQFLGYKFITTALSLWVPLLAIKCFGLPVHLERLPVLLVMVMTYLVLLHQLSFCVASMAFHLTKVQSLIAAKNLTFWFLSGELFPLDLLPEPWRMWITALPFCNGVYVPVGYVTGRLEFDAVLSGWFSVVVGIVVMMPVCQWVWNRGMRSYVGTGA